jgi:hypothetical protein
MMPVNGLRRNCAFFHKVFSGGSTSGILALFVAYRDGCSGAEIQPLFRRISASVNHASQPTRPSLTNASKGVAPSETPPETRKILAKG